MTKKAKSKRFQCDDARIGDLDRKMEHIIEMLRDLRDNLNGSNSHK